MKRIGIILGVITKSKSILLFAGLAFLTNKNQAQTVIDYDGNMYDTVIIGTQVWMMENLKTTKYRDGTLISNVTDDVLWAGLSSGAYCNYNNYDVKCKRTSNKYRIRKCAKMYLRSNLLCSTKSIYCIDNPNTTWSHSY